MSAHPWSARRLAIALAGASAAALLAMVIVMLATGASQEAHERYQPPAEYARDLLAQPGALRLLFGLDVGFIVLYTAFFAAFTDYLRRLGRPFVRLALGAMIGTAVLDFIEDQHILSLLAVAEAGRPIHDAALVFQQTLSATKWSLSYLALVLYGLAVPRDRWLGIVLSAFLVTGTLIIAVVGFAAPPAWNRLLDAARTSGLLIGFGLGIAWLHSMPEPPPSPHARPES